VERVSLGEAVERHVRPGDTVYVAMGHHRWTAAARELARQHWRADPGFTLVMPSLGSLGVLFVHGGLVTRIVTAYSGDAFPTYSPNPVFQRAYETGAVEPEHWSFLTLIRRLEAAGLGLPAMPVHPLGRSSIAENSSYDEIDVAGERVGMVRALAPDVTLLHAVAADRAGNIAIAPPALDGVAGAFAARRGCVVTTERVVEDLSSFAGFTRIPAHRVLAVAETPFGAHPGGCYAGALGLHGYAEDVDAWIEARDAARGDLDEWARQWCLDVTTHDDYLERVGADRLAWLRMRLDPESWRDDEAAYPVDEAAPTTPWETAAAYAARELTDRVMSMRADAVLGGAGVANLVAWVAVARAREQGHDTRLTAELGLWGYQPTPADPSIFNFRAFPSAAMLTDATTVLGTLVGGPGTRTIGCLGAAQVDVRGDLNSTQLATGRFLVGAGGGTDVAVGADEVLVVTLLRAERTPEQVGYVTAPGDAVQTVVTDLGVLRRRDGELHLAGVAAGEGSVDDRVRTAVASCGWPLTVDRTVDDLPPVSTDEVLALRRFDPRGWFLTG
jgi:acyl CoA:acetate/3-ketoacid CoA transferase alpha subunit/acyl CoA:acetate/3-ketoacid CoA transferase beta subunit